MSPDQLAVAIIALTVVSLILATSYVFSFAAIADAAKNTGPDAWTHLLAPGFIDGAILAYTIVYAVFRFRREPAKRTLVFLYVFTAISVIVNVAHTLAFNSYAWDRPGTYLGALIAASAPLAALFASEEVIRLALTPPPLPSVSQFVIDPNEGSDLAPLVRSLGSGYREYSMDDLVGADGGLDPMRLSPNSGGGAPPGATDGAPLARGRREDITLVRVGRNDVGEHVDRVLDRKASVLDHMVGDGASFRPARESTSAAGEPDPAVPTDADAPFDPDYDLTPEDHHVTAGHLDPQVWSEVAFDPFIHQDDPAYF